MVLLCKTEASITYLGYLYVSDRQCSHTTKVDDGKKKWERHRGYQPLGDSC